MDICCIPGTAAVPQTRRTTSLVRLGWDVPAQGVARRFGCFLPSTEGRGERLRGRRPSLCLYNLEPSAPPGTGGFGERLADPAWPEGSGAARSTDHAVMNGTWPIPGRRGVSAGARLRSLSRPRAEPGARGGGSVMAPQRSQLSIWFVWRIGPRHGKSRLRVRGCESLTGSLFSVRLNSFACQMGS